MTRSLVNTGWGFRVDESAIAYGPPDCYAGLAKDNRNLCHDVLLLSERRLSREYADPRFVTGHV